MKFAYRTESNARAVAAYWGKPLDKPEWYSVNALSGDNPEIYIYSVIGWPYTDEEVLVRSMAEVKGKHILARINSPGGDVMAGMALFNAMANHPGGVTVRIEGMAASMASVVAMAGVKVEAYPNTSFMIHNAWIPVVGDHHVLREIADITEKISGQMRDIYVGKTKTGKKDMAQMMDVETYMTAQDARDKGFVDVILSGRAVKAEFDLSMFANCPDWFKGEVTDDHIIFTGFDVEKALRDAKAPKGFAKAVAAACRAAKLVDGRQADDELNAEDDAHIESERKELAELTAAARELVAAMK